MEKGAVEEPITAEDQRRYEEELRAGWRFYGVEVGFEEFRAIVDRINAEKVSV